MKLVEDTHIYYTLFKRKEVWPISYRKTLDCIRVNWKKIK